MANDEPRQRLDYRYCNTHALGAQLFAARPMHHSNRDVWEYVAQAWSELAELKRRTALPRPEQPR